MARYADRLLADGERVALRGRQHILATVIEGRVPWALLILSLVLLVLDLQLEPGGVRDVFGLLGLVLLLVSLGWLLYVYLEWYSQDYLVTNRRVLKVEGILGKRSADSSLEKINDAVLQQSLFGRMLGYGDLDIMTDNLEAMQRQALQPRPRAALPAHVPTPAPAYAPHSSASLLYAQFSSPALPSLVEQLRPMGSPRGASVRGAHCPR